MMLKILNIILLMFVIPRLMTEEIQNSNQNSKKLINELEKAKQTSKDSKDVDSSDEQSGDHGLLDDEEDQEPSKDTNDENALFEDTAQGKHFEKYKEVLKNRAPLDEDAKKLQSSTAKGIKKRSGPELDYQELINKDTIPKLSLNKDKLNDSLIETKIYRSHLDDHTIVTDEELFPFMVAVLKGAAYLCAGALINEHWVLTAADKLFLMSDTVRFLRVRLGSVNYKKGGKLLPVKYLEIHPHFDRYKPTYDLALVKLSKPVRYTPSLRSIRLQKIPKEVTTTHFLVPSWSRAAKSKTNSIPKSSLHRILTVTHLHPLDPEECVEELKETGAGHDGVICLETGPNDACTREVGAPVVINGVLWAVTSSWRPGDCDQEDPPPVFAVLVSATNISTWIHAAVHGHKWHLKNIYMPKYFDIFYYGEFTKE